MSYDLWFWKQNDRCEMSPADIADSLSCGREVSDLETLDISRFTKRIIEEFPTIETHFNPDTNELRQLILDPSDEDWVILCGWDSAHFTVESHSAPGEVLNQFVEIAMEFNCPLYDPQTGSRYA